MRRNDLQGQQARRSGFSKGIVLPLAVCVLSAIGSTAGVMLTAHYSTSAYQYQKAFEWEVIILEKRVQTMERMARLIAQQPGLKDEWARYRASLKLSTPDEVPPRESSQKLEDYTAEYVNVLLLTSLYFGAETKKAVAALQKTQSPWWMKDYNDQDAILTAMNKELRSSLPKFNSTLQVRED